MALIIRFVICVLFVSVQLFGYSRVQGWCEQGNRTITVAGVSSSTLTPVQASFPSCTVTVTNTVGGGTSTVYSTSTGTGLSNPFAADTTGYWYFYAADGNYNVQFSGTGIGSPFTTGGHANIDPFYTSTQSGYVPRLKNDKLSDMLSVKDFGAVGDGTTNDYTAFNTALANSTLTKCIYVPDGTYAIATPLNITIATCIVGNSWRLKYTGSPATQVWKVTGDPSNNHSSFMEGTVIEGVVIDGNGQATNGLTFQGVVSARLNYSGITNVTGIGFNCNWCQQVHMLKFRVSDDYETFTTVPQTGINIDGLSSANLLIDINIDHVSSHGVTIPYGINTTVIGGTSEGNSGYGVYCTSAVSPLHQCFNNLFEQFDTEVNTLGDFYFSDGTFFNTIIQSNGFSHPGITFAGSAHANTVMGGQMGCGSTAGVNTFGNYIINVSVTCVDATVPWVDLGNNVATRIYDQFHATWTEPINNYNSTTITRFSTASTTRGYTLYTPSDLIGGFTVGNQTQFIGMEAQSGFTNAWFRYSINGISFVSETSPRTGVVPNGSIVGGKWGFGNFNQTPSYKFHFFDSVLSQLVIQAGAGQGGNDFMQFRDFAGTTRYGGISHLGEWDAPIKGGTIGSALCKKSDGTIGSCTTVVGSGGTCTCM